MPSIQILLASSPKKPTFPSRTSSVTSRGSCYTEKCYAVLRIYIYIYLDTTFFKRILEASIGAHCEKMLESEPGEGLLLSSLTHTKPGSQNFNISWDTSQKLQGTTPSWEVLSALSALTGPQNELLAVRHPAPKKLISLRRHKVAEATIEHLGFVGLPFGGGGRVLSCSKSLTFK